MMLLLVLHAFWSIEHGLGLWAEDSGKTVKSPGQAVRSARPHPFAATGDVVLGLQPGAVGSTTLWLRSLRQSPLDSPEVVRVVPQRRGAGDPSLLSWLVPVVWVGPEADGARPHPASDAEAHGRVLERALLPEGFSVAEGTPPFDPRMAPSVRFLQELLRFADELAQRGRVIPEIAWTEKDGKGDPVAQSRWRAVLRGPDALAFGDLTAATPPSFRAEPGSEDAGELVAAALDVLTDAAVRRRLPTDLRILPPRRGRKPGQLPVVEAWLEALSSPNADLNAPEPALEDLERALAPWAGYAVEATSVAPATFRLGEINGAEVGEPARPGTQRWRVEFLLQSAADPSLLVPAEQVWRDDGALSRLLGRPQEILLGGLGKAARIYPGIEHGLRQSRPQSMEPDTEAAFDFLRHGAPALAEEGFGVFLPAWWDQLPEVGLTVRSHPLAEVLRPVYTALRESGPEM
ncbi:SNF2 helicase-associated domain-containing protein [Paeniglutamicibacter psychrophenolicus]|uniref:SNF2 helicase-associated domain-containing protein n=1 Tax=Paeniglutamicibacter psychrophenolicus TaxID=257454 RepID=UPI0027892060|nr:SNF2 helicase-associated domain-containing protein [Paeniglutamicibacter psychrophenolicus]MDQ0094560.1 hypothetical protein [Paeniglutamicibacter psychrophenolicus]